MAPSKKKQSKKSTSPSPATTAASASPPLSSPSEALRVTLRADVRHLRDRQQQQQHASSLSASSSRRGGSSGTEETDSTAEVWVLPALHRQQQARVGKGGARSNAASERKKNAAMLFTAGCEHVVSDVPIRLPCEGVVLCSIAIRVTPLAAATSA